MELSSDGSEESTRPFLSEPQNCLPHGKLRDLETFKKEGLVEKEAQTSLNLSIEYKRQEHWREKSCELF